MIQRTWESIEPGERLPTITDLMTFTRVASAPAATLDWYPLHHDPEFARAQGHPGIVLSTVQLMGLVDRAVTEWAGPATFVRRRQIRLARSVFVDDVLTCTGTVRAKRSDDEEASAHVGRPVDVDILIANAEGATCCVAEVTVILPTAAS